MKCRVLLIFIIVLFLIAANVEGRRRVKKIKHKQNKQLSAESKETSPPNFFRLLVMRLVYGMAAQMGFEERISGIFNGAFVPPNAEEDYFDFGVSDGDEFGLLDDI